MRWFGILVLVGTSMGCGQKGPLFLPDTAKVNSQKEALLEAKSELVEQQQKVTETENSN